MPDQSRIRRATAVLAAAMAVLLSLATVRTQGAGRAGASSVRISDIHGYLQDGIPSVEWRLTDTKDVVGFFLTRSDDASGDGAEAVNSELLPSLPEAWVSRRFRLADNGADPAGTYYYTLTVVGVRGEETRHGPFLLRFDSPSSPRADQTVQQEPLSRKVEAVEQGDRVKILIRHDDLYMMSASGIAECLSGVTASSVVDAISETNINLSHGGKDVSWLPAPGGTGVVFYAEGLESIYTRDNVYWLSLASGNVMNTHIATGSVPVVTNRAFAQTVKVEDNGLLGLAYFDDPEGDFWLSTTYYVFYYLGTPYNATINLDLLGVATGHQHLAACDVVLAGWDQDHSIRATLTNAGGVVASTTESWSGDHLKTISLSFTGTAWFAEGQNTVQLDTLADSGYIVEYFDKLTVTYPRYYQAATNRLGFPALSYSNITVSGFTSSNITLLDVTDPWEPVLITTTNVGQAPGGDYRVSFEPEGSNYFAAVTFGSPHSINGVDNTHWRDPTNTIEHVIVTVPELASAAQRLADHRNSQGLSSSVLLNDVLYNEFNHGIASPWAVRSFLSYVSTNWAVPPGYILLGGAGTLDFRDFNNAGATDPCHIPPVVVYTSFGLFGCDNPMADIDDDRVIDVPIGRLPAADSDDFDRIVDKIIAYESGSDWRENVTIVADNEDAGGFFWQTSDAIAEQVNTNFTVNKAYLWVESPTSNNMAEVRAHVEANLNAGAGYLNYMGHGNHDVMSDIENTPTTPLPIMNIDDVSGFTNSARPSVISAMTCRLGRFALPGTSSKGLGEALLADTVGGAVIMWAPVSESFNAEGGAHLRFGAHLECVSLC